WFWGCGIISSIILLLSVALPLMQIITTRRTWIELPNVIRAARGVIGNSFAFSAGTAALCVLIALAWHSATGPPSKKAQLHFRGFSGVGLLLWIPLLAPGVLLGIALIFLLNRPVLDAIYRGAGIVLIAWIIRYLACGWNAARLAIQGGHGSRSAAARLAGAAGWAW